MQLNYNPLIVLVIVCKASSLTQSDSAAGAAKKSMAWWILAGQNALPALAPFQAHF